MTCRAEYDNLTDNLSLYVKRCYMVNKMSKLGRNEPCPCGSGLKYKKCCLHNPQNNLPVPEKTANRRVSIRQAIEAIREEALQKIEKVSVMGVFILLSTESGDAWLLEVTDMDAIRLAKKGKLCEFELEENPETIMINWSHKFNFDNDKFVTTAYANNRKAVYKGYPVDKIKKAMEKTKEKITPEILKELHVPTETEK